MKLIITNQKVKDRAMSVIGDIPLDGSKEIHIKDHTKDRSISQHALKWMWVTDISDYTGESKKDVNTRLKRDFLLPIYERDDVGEYRTTIELVRNVWRSGYTETATSLHNKVAALSKSSDANVKQMTEFMNDIERHAISENIPLRHPEDYRYAMGIENRAREEAA